jgi:TorA maturation chaperone TorD
MQTLLVLRQTLFRFFSLLFLYPSTENLFGIQLGASELLNSHQAWSDKPYAEKLSTLLALLSNVYPDDRKKIVDEYNRLFLVKPKVSPYETSYLKLLGQSEGTIAADVSGIYGWAGLVVSPDMNELPDHIAVELEFMSFLYEKEITANEEGSPTDITTTQQEQRDFMTNHLARWYPQFAKKALSEADENLIYRNVVETLYSFLRSELEILKIREPQGSN